MKGWAPSASVPREVLHVQVTSTWLWGPVFPQCILVPCGPQASTRTRRPHDVDHLLPLLRGPVLKPRCPSEPSRVDRGQSGRPDWSAAPYPTHWDALSIRTRLSFFSRWSYRSSPVAFGPPPSGRLDRRHLPNPLRCQEAVQRYSRFVSLHRVIWHFCQFAEACECCAECFPYVVF